MIRTSALESQEIRVGHIVLFPLKPAKVFVLHSSQNAVSAAWHHRASHKPLMQQAMAVTVKPASLFTASRRRLHDDRTYQNLQFEDFGTVRFLTLNPKPAFVITQSMAFGDLMGIELHRAPTRSLTHNS